MVESRWYNTDIPKIAVFLFHNSKKWRNVFVKSVNFLIQKVGVQSIWILILYPKYTRHTLSILSLEFSS